MSLVCRPKGNSARKAKGAKPCALLETLEKAFIEYYWTAA